MKKSIKRRDFLNGAAIAIAAGSTLPARSLIASDSVEQLLPTPASDGLGKKYYPPTRTGIRGSHNGSFEIAHDLAWRGNKPEQYSELDEGYDLIIVGGGISGLAAAYLYQQQAGADKKILILDNHDDFGGHAKRNEFQLGDRTLLGPGGSFNLEHYSFSDTAARVISELDIDLDKLDAAREPDFLLAQLNSSQGYFLNEEHYGQNKIIQGHWPSALEGDEETVELIQELGLPPEQHQRLLDLINGEKDLLDDLSLLETKDYIGATSYEEFLIKKAGLSLDTVRTFESFNKIFMG
ncbi:NAD(P)-binding protein [Pseudohalioglobus sediminis]|uniref:NAD(P)-binding protein n=1 Tax=Pseudohalioglobus sediminis TaxID=2606449 RepID=UPI0021CE1E07|nr:FAD-dependent oxidoreductase [Pseudohalioglobus sediminis]